MTVRGAYSRTSQLVMRSHGQPETLLPPRWLPAAASGAGLGVPASDLADPVPVHGSDDEVWMLSYMDIMTLLLTLLVLLFVYTQAVAPESGAAEHARGSAERVETKREQPRVASAAAVAAFQADAPIGLPPQWLGSLVEPPIPELMVRFGDADEHAGVADAAVASGEASVAEKNSEATPAAAAVAHAAPTPPDAVPVATPAASPEVATRPPDRTHEARLAAAPEQEAQSELLAAIAASELGRRVEVTRRQDAVNLEIGDEILFDRGSAEVKPGGEALLAELADLLRQQAVTVSVEGHTDDAPIRNARFASNWELSAARATNVTRQLLAHAVDPARVRAVGHADTRPRADNATVEGRARNRRVSVVLHVPAALHPTPGNAATR